MTKTASKHSVVIIKDRCKGCGLCIEFCPKEVLVFSEDLNAQGYHYADPVKLDACTGCMICVTVCPDLAVEVYDG